MSGSLDLEKQHCECDRLGEIYAVGPVGSLRLCFDCCHFIVCPWGLLLTETSLHSYEWKPTRMLPLPSPLKSWKNFRKERVMFI